MNEIATAPPQALEPAESGASTTSLLNFVAMAVRDPNIDVAKLDALLKMQREIAHEQAKLDFARAMANVQAAMPRVKKNGRVELGSGKGSYDFARWEDMDRALRPLLGREGLSLSFDTTDRPGGGAIITATVEHVGGHSRSASIPLPLDSGAGRNNLQAMGSTISYGKRYCAECLFNIVREGQDDDGIAGGTTLVSAEQARELGDLVRETKSDLDGFLHFMGVAGIASIRAGDFAKAKNALLAKKRAMAKARPIHPDSDQGEPT